MGQAFDRTGHLLGEVLGDTKRAVFDELMKKHADAAEIRIKTLSEELAASQPSSAVNAEMPRYKCHKEVHALKIKAVVQSLADKAIDGGSWELVFEDEGYVPRTVAHAWYVKHQPVEGGYFVVYHDDYSSFSPAGAFEDGYTRI